MKENLKVETPNHGDSQKAHILFKDMGYLYVFDDEMYVYAICNPLSFQPRIISFDELNELAHPKEYLTNKFELVVTNQPDDGWILVPESSEMYVYFEKEDKYHFYRKIENKNRLDIFDHWQKKGEWSDTNIENIDTFKLIEESKILWQRENKVETVKGRFLHQWAYEAFGRGEDVQHTPCLRDCPWTTVTMDKTIGIFNNPHNKFRLKPKTIQIGSRTITKPISVKPEIGTEYFMPSLSSSCKYLYATWDDNYDKEVLGRSLCHLTKEDAISHCEALLELMK